MNKQKLLISGASAPGMLCTFLPWMEEYGKTYAGWEMDGWITLALFGTSLAICLGGNMKESLDSKFRLGIYGTSGLATIIGLSKIAKATPAFGKILPDWLPVQFAYSWQIQFGLYLMVAFGLLILALNTFLHNSKNKPF